MQARQTMIQHCCMRFRGVRASVTSKLRIRRTWGVRGGIPSNAWAASESKQEPRSHAHGHAVLWIANQNRSEEI
jgi:hypothetical protein